MYNSEDLCSNSFLFLKQHVSKVGTKNVFAHILGKIPLQWYTVCFNIRTVVTKKCTTISLPVSQYIDCSLICHWSIVLKILFCTSLVKYLYNDMHFITIDLQGTQKNVPQNIWKAYKIQKIIYLATEL